MEKLGLILGCVWPSSPHCELIDGNCFASLAKEFVYFSFDGSQFLIFFSLAALKSLPSPLSLSFSQAFFRRIRCCFLGYRKISEEASTHVVGFCPLETTTTVFFPRIIFIRFETPLIRFSAFHLLLCVVFTYHARFGILICCSPISSLELCCFCFRPFSVYRNRSAMRDHCFLNSID